MARLEGAFEQIDKRLGRLEDHVERGFNRVDARFERLEQKIDRQFLWVVGLLVVSILLPISQRLILH